MFVVKHHIRGEAPKLSVAADLRTALKLRNAGLDEAFCGTRRSPPAVSEHQLTQED